MAINIAVDIMGGDYAPRPILDGAREALEQFGDQVHLLLAGPEAVIRDYFAATPFVEGQQYEICDAPETVTMGEHPVSAIRNKRHSSIAVCMDLVKEKRADAVFSAGNTGASVAAAFLKWRMIPGISRPGIATPLPTAGDPMLLLDAGATVDCTAEMLLHFALMGSVYMETVMHRPHPRIGLLSNGTEETKGNKLVQETYALLSAAKQLNFIGNVEGHGLFSGDVDLVVCDGFIGNVLLKTCEELAKTIRHIVKGQMKKNIFWALGGLISKGAFGELKRKMDFSEFGGAPLLGVNGVCLIGHGISDAKAVRNGIRAAKELVRLGVNDRIAAAARELPPME